MNSSAATSAPRPTGGRRRGAVGAIVVAALGAILLAAEGPLTGLSYDLAYLLRRPEVPPEAVLVLMDESSHRREGQPLLRPWSRRLHARLIRNLASHGPRAIVLDAYLPAPDESEADRELVAAAREYGKVAVAAYVPRNEEIGGVGGAIRPPFDALREVVRWGPAEPGPGVVREVFAGFSSVASLPEQVARLAGPEAAPPAVAGSASEPTSNPGRRYLRYYGPPGTITGFSYSDVLAGRIPGRQFSNVVVFVGEAYKGPPLAGGRHSAVVRGDIHETPYHRWNGELSTGVELVATASLNELRRDALRRLGPWTELGLVLVVGLAGTWLTTVLRPGIGTATAAGVGLLLAWLGTGGVWWTGIWGPWLIPVAVQIPLALAWGMVWRLDHRSIGSAVGTAPLQTSPGGILSPGDPREARPILAGHFTATDESLVRHAPPPERRLAEHTLLRVIGRGGYGEVWLARNSLGEPRAIKIVDRHSFGDGRPFDREFEGIRRFSPLSLKHPGLIHVLHVGRDDTEGRFHYVMEIADDESGRRDVEAARYRPRTLEGELQRGGALGAAAAVEVAVGIGEALAYLHARGLVHRDVKPGNILFVEGRPKLADVGLVTAMAATGQEVSQVGTLGYVPPEGAGTVQADVFALGKVLYVAVTGKPARSFPELPTDIDRRSDATGVFALNEILLKACDPDPEERYATMTELLDALRSVRVEPQSRAGEPE